ncbi:MAG: hypothetical protein P8J33_12160 [Pirellulaceae bacterium]|nr:hypothetical protein [Pirellulaceae bacterium]
MTKRKRFDRRHFETTEQIPLEADAVRIARVAQLGGLSMRMAEVDPFDGLLMDPLDDLASEWSAASEEEDQLIWGE